MVHNAHMDNSNTQHVAKAMRQIRTYIVDGKKIEVAVRVCKCELCGQVVSRKEAKPTQLYDGRVLTLCAMCREH